MNLRIAVSTLSAFAGQGSREFAVVVFGLFVGIPAVPMAIFSDSGDDPHKRIAGAFVASVFISIGVGIVWLYYACNGITLLRNARALRMPSTAHAVLSALFLLFAATVIAPAAFLGWYGRGEFTAFLGVLASAAFAGLLFTLLNRAMFVGLVLASFGAILIQQHYSLELPISLPHIGDRSFALMAVGMAFVLGTLCAVRWVQLQSQERALFAWAGQTAMTRDIYQPDASTGNGYSLGSGQRAHHRARFNLKGLGPQRPVSAMGAWLGSPFAPLIWRQRVIDIGWILVLILFFAFTISKELLLPWLGFMASISFLVPFGPRLRHLFRRRSGEMAELALIPGWGNARQVRRILLQAVFQTLGKQFVALFVAIVLMALVLETPSAAYLTIAEVAIGVGSLSVAFTMRALADMESTIEVVLLLVVMLIAGGMLWRVRFGGHLGANTLLHMNMYWLVLSVLMGLLTLHAYRCFIARPHPFLGR